MNKKTLLIDYLFVFVMSISILLTSFFVTSFVAKNETKDNLNYYATQISMNYDSNNNLSEIETKYSSLKDLRITLFDKEANVLLDINPLGIEPAKEDRSNELIDGNFYSKDSKTLNYQILYYVKEHDTYFVRVGFPESNVNRISIYLLIYEGIALVVLDTIYFFFKYKSYKRSINSLKKEVNNLQCAVNLDPLNDNSDGVAIIEETISKVNSVIVSQLENIKKEDMKTNYILDSINEGIFVIDSNENVLLINKYALLGLKTTKENVLNKNYRCLLLGEEFSEKINTLDSSSFIDKNINGKIYEFIINKIDLNWLNDSKGIGVIMLDVTTTRLNEKLKKEFFQNASHELKTPLTTIVGYSDLISKNIITEKSELDDAVNSIGSEAKRMQNIIDDMLALSSIENKLDLETRVELNVKSAIEEILKSLSLMIQNKNIEVETNLEDVTLSIAPQDFDRLTRNLISNAIKYNKENGRITINLTQDFLSVEDTGIGIEQKYYNRVFERFYRVDKSRSKKEGGTGLGLAIVKHICLNYGFKIEVKSELGKGSKFTIKFK
jgi:two-component system, OmpR family, phosphate regulon sensor histidine kinase PhoR